MKFHKITHDEKAHKFVVWAMWDDERMYDIQGEFKYNPLMSHTHAKEKARFLAEQLACMIEYEDLDKKFECQGREELVGAEKEIEELKEKINKLSAENRQLDIKRRQAMSCLEE